MSNLMKTGHHDAFNPANKLFEGEKWLVITGLIGFVLAAGIAIYLFFQDHIIPPEGNMKDAFSFNAAIGFFILSIAAILPLAGLRDRYRSLIRWLLIIASIYSYVIETVQNFRGLNPRFSTVGTNLDLVAGIIFGVVSLLLVTLAILLTIQFFRLKASFKRPLLILGIRYAFLSVLVANFAGLWMATLQDRFIGDSGNLIVLHGISFHALQTLILPGWFLERAQVSEELKKAYIHFGSIAWMLSIISIGVHTALGRSVFELAALPIIACILMLIWLWTAIMACFHYIKRKKSPEIQSNQVPIENGE